MKKSVHFSILATVFTFLITNSQSSFSDQLAAENNMMFSVKKKSRVNTDIEGSPYINEKFQPISISGKKAKNIQGRYNGYNGDMEVLDVSRGTVYVLNRQLTNYDVVFTAQKKTYRSYEYKADDARATYGFFLTLNNNEGIALLKKENVKFYKEKKAQSTYEKARKAKYKRGMDKYYVKIGSNPALALNTRKKEIASLFPEKEKQILAFIKSNKINTKKESDLIMLFNQIPKL